MQTFAQIQKQSQRTSSLRRAQPNPATSVPDHRQNLIQCRREAFGNQAKQAMLRANTVAPNVGLTGPTSPHSSYAFNRISIYPAAGGVVQTKPPIVSSGRKRDQAQNPVADMINGNHESQDVAQEGFAGPAHPLPHLERIQSAFGSVHDLSKIRAHTDAAADQATRRLSAWGFTFGNEIAFRGKPSLHLAAHEAAHVVQQRSGVLSAVGVESTDAWEQHADAVADRVVQGRSAAELLAPFTRGSERAQVQFQKARRNDKQSSSRKGPDLDELAKWPAEALSAWPTLDDNQRVLVTLAIAARYGVEFAQIFKAEAGLSHRKEPVNYYYGPGITWITPQKLFSRGFRLAQQDSVHEWWVDPKGNSVTRRWDRMDAQAESKPSEPVPPVEETKPTPPIPNVEPTPPERKPPSEEACKDIQQLGDAICDNASRICRIADELGDDPQAKATCLKAQRSCEEARKRERVCGPPAVS